jgi:hypothetical protein
LTQRRHRSLRLCLRTGFSPINAIVLTGKTWYPALGAGTCGGTRVMQALRGKPLPARRVGVPRTWKGFRHEESSVSVSDRCHHRYHCLGDTITSSGWRGGWGGWGAGPARGVIAGTVIGGIVAGVPAHGPGYCYYRGPDDYYARGAYYGPWCYMGYQYGR